MPQEANTEARVRSGGWGARLSNGTQLHEETEAVELCPAIDPLPVAHHVYRDPVEGDATACRRDREELAVVRAAHREPGDDLVADAEDVVDLHRQIREGNTEAEDHRLEAFATTGMRDVGRKVLLEHSRIASVPCPLNEVTYGGDVRVDGHTRDPTSAGSNGQTARASLGADARARAARTAAHTSAGSDELEHAGQSLGSRSSRLAKLVSNVGGLPGCPLADVAFEIVAKKYREIRSALSAAGWEVLRQRGSHEVWAKPGEKARIVVAGKDSDPVPVGTLSSIRRASGLEHLR